MVKLQKELPNELTQEEVINTIEEEIFRLPFLNNRFERVYPTNTEVISNEITVDMSDGTVFKIVIRKLK